MIFHNTAEFKFLTDDIIYEESVDIILYQAVK